MLISVFGRLSLRVKMLKSEQAPSAATCLSDADQAGTIHIVAGCDDGYARHLGVMLLSLFEHAKTCPVMVHVLVPPQFSSQLLLEEALGGDAAKLAYYILDVEDMPGPKERSDLTSATYYRLHMGECLPPEVDRVIYLDCDMLICGDLAELWRTSLGDSVAAAVADPAFTERNRLGLADNALYFNAGVMLIDIARWRDEEIGKRTLDFRMSHPERVTYDDQCALNWILRGRWLELDAIWNVQTFLLAEMVDGEVRYFQPRPALASHARIVHFNAPGRPWLYMDEHPFKREYLSYKARTPWRAERPADRYPHNIVIKTLRRHAPVLLPAYHMLRRYI